MTIADIADKLIEVLYRPTPAPAGWLNELPEAFAAVDDVGNVEVIGYKGEWYFTRKPSLRVRLRNWLIRRTEVEPDAQPAQSPNL